MKAILRYAVAFPKSEILMPVNARVGSGTFCRHLERADDASRREQA